MKRLVKGLLTYSGNSASQSVISQSVILVDNTGTQKGARQGKDGVRQGKDGVRQGKDGVRQDI